MPSIKCPFFLRIVILCSLCILGFGCRPVSTNSSPTSTAAPIPSISAAPPIAVFTQTNPPPVVFDPEKSGELLAVGRANPEAGALNSTLAVDSLTGQFKLLGEGWPVAWSPSGKFLLARHDNSFIIYDRRGAKALPGTELIDQSEFPLNQNTFFWLPIGVLPGSDDWLVIQNKDDQGLEALGIPSGERRILLSVKSLGAGAPSFRMEATTTGWLAWVPIQASLAQAGQTGQTLSAIQVANPSQVHTWTLSKNIEKAYYTVLDAVPGASLVLLGAAPASTAGMDGVALYTFDLESGILKDLRVKMLPNPDAYAWSPTQPGKMALAVGDGHSTSHNKSLASLDVKTGEVKYLTDPKMAAFEPNWSPDGEKLAYVALPDANVSPNITTTALSGRAIYVYDFGTGQSKAITSPGTSIDGWPHWLKDQTKILFARYDGQQQTTLYLENIADETIISLGIQINATFLFDKGRCQSDQCSWNMILLYTHG
ncbi:MAG: hypothetical protein WA821_18140 [Anaerolineales bacterium]